MKAIEKLKNKGYNVVFNMSGTVSASKGSRTYVANTVTGLVKKILG